MEVILDELQKNNVDIDMKTLSYHIYYLLEYYKLMYQAILAKSPNMTDIFYEIDVINFGRAMSYLTLIMMNDAEEIMRRAVRIVAAPLKNMDCAAFKIEESFLRRMISYVTRVLTK